MNCKAGDLAIIVAPDREGDGRLVEVIRAATPADVVMYEPGAWFVKVLGDGLRMYGKNGSVIKLQYCALKDSVLRPIRDTPGDDESLLWAPVHGERVTA